MRSSAGPRTASRTSRRRTATSLGYGYGYALAQREHLHDRRHLRDRPRAALALLRARRDAGRSAATARPSTTSTRDFFFQRINDTKRGREAARRRRRRTGPQPRDHARRHAATSPATTATSRETGVDNIPDPALPRASRGSRRSPRSTPTGASTSWRCSPARAWRSTASAARSRPRRRARCRPLGRQAPTLGELARAELPLGGIGSNAVALGTAGDRQRPRHAARQPALPVGRLRALLPGAAHDPRQARRRGRLAARRAARADRPHRAPGLEPHGLHRVPLHAVRAEARPGLADDATCTTASRAR